MQRHSSNPAKSSVFGMNYAPFIPAMARPYPNMACCQAMSGIHADELFFYLGACYARKHTIPRGGVQSRCYGPLGPASQYHELGGRLLGRRIGGSCDPPKSLPAGWGGEAAPNPTT